jgi:signal transduction histidine kinase
MTVLAQVLVGRDEPPAWRSATSRRMAYVAAWLGWALLALAEIFEAPPGPRLAVVLVVCAAVPLLPRRPLLGWRIACLGALITPLIPGQNHVDTGYYVILVITFTVAGLRYGPPRLWWLAILTLIPVWVWTPSPPLASPWQAPPWQAPPWRHPDWTYPLRDTIGLAVLVAAGYTAGRWRRDRLALAARSREAAEQAELARREGERARQAAERSAVLAERARIAREMHDVVAHHMSMIAVQAETAPYRIADLPEGATAEFAALSQAAREALVDMRRLLGVLRSSSDQGSSSEQGSSGDQGRPGNPAREDPERAPQPGLADVPTLVDSARRAGAEVALEMPGRNGTGNTSGTGTVAPVVGLTAYRIVQESLSNAARHAPGAPIRVSVQEEDGVIRVTVLNEAGDTPAPREPDGIAGHGLAGMRERAALVGGQVRAGPEAAGGFAVRAELPTRLPVASVLAGEDGRHSADQHSADQHSADQHSADQHSADRHGADRYGVAP